MVDLPGLILMRSRVLLTIQRLNWVAPLLARVTLGVLFMSTGWGKVHSLNKVAAYFVTLHIPAAALQATMVSYVELVGGALLLLGLASRLAALPLLASMTVAILTAKRGDVHGLPDLFGLVEWTYLVLLAWILLAGPGKIALDHWLSICMSRRTGGESSADKAPTVSNA